MAGFQVSGSKFLLIFVQICSIFVDFNLIKIILIFTGNQGKNGRGFGDVDNFSHHNGSVNIDSVEINKDDSFGLESVSAAIIDSHGQNVLTNFDIADGGFVAVKVDTDGGIVNFENVGIILIFNGNLG